MPIKGILGGAGVKPLGYGLGSAETEESEPNFNQTVLLLHGDGSEGEGNTSVLGNPNYKAFKDNSTSAHALVVNGDAYGNDFSPHYYPDGYWSEFYNDSADSGGNCNHKILPASFLNDLTIANKSTSTKTVEAWVYPTSIRTSSVQYYAMGWFCKGNIYWDCALWSTSSTTSGKFTAYHYDGTQRPLESSNNFTVGQWYHVALVIASGTIKLYVNGALEGSRTWHGLGSTGIGEVSVIGGTASNNDWNGYISNLRVSSTARYPSAFTPSTSPFTSDSDTLLLTNQSNRFVDNSSSANTFTFQNNPKITTNTPFTQSKTANVGSGFFDGNTDNLTTIGSSDFAVGTGDFTFEAWVYPSILPSVSVVLDLRYSNNNSGDNISALTLFGSTLGNYSGGNRTAGTDIPIIINQWNHIVIQRISGTQYYAVNGKVSSTTSSLTNNLNNAGQRATIGGNVDQTSVSMYTGYIADLRVVNGTGVYGTSNFSVPTAPLTAVTNTKLLTCQYSGAVRNVGFVDDSKYNHQITRNGDVAMGTFSPFSLEDTYWSNYLNGNHPIEIADSGNGLDLSGDFTVEFWAYEPQIATAGATTNMYFTIDTLDRFQVGNNSSNLFVYINGGNTLNGTTSPLNQWNHIALVRSGSSSNNISLYRNGSRLAQGTSTYSIAAASMMLGGQDRGGTTGYHGFFGYISNFRILKGTALYSGASITVPTAPLTAITNTSLLTCQSNRFIDNSTNSMALTTDSSSPAKIQPFSPFAPTRSYSKDAVGGSAYFDGTSDYLSIPDSGLFTLGTDNFTIECWVYFNSIAGTQYVYGQSHGSSGGATAFQLYVSSGNLYAWTGHGSASATAPKANEWVHLAFVRQGANIRIYYNGVQQDSTDIGASNALTNSTGVLALGRVGAYDASYFAGYISNFNFVRGVCKYDDGTTFTAPTAPITAHANTVFLANFNNAGIIDHTMKNNLETESNTRISGQQVKFGTGSILFDGTTDEIKMVNSPMQQPRTGEFTIEFFVYFNATGNHGFFGNGTSGYYGQLFNGNFQFVQGATANISTAWSYSTGQWYHVALARDSSNNTKLFINGTQLGSTATSDTNDYYNATVALSIGDIGGGYNRRLNGYIDEFRLTKGVARYTSDFTAPTKAFANK